MIRSIPDIQVTDQATRDALEAMKEIIEVMLGRRGSDPNDHVLTRGDSSTIVKLFEALNTGLSHDTLADVSADDHHSQSHNVASHTDTTVTGAELDADHSKLAGIEASAKDDQIASEVTNTPAGNIAATDVQAAINELDTEKEGTTTSHAARHVTGGGDTIADVIAAGNAGLMTGADKTKLDGIAAGAQTGTVTAVTGTSPVVSSGGLTPAISMPAATNAAAGHASAAHITAIEANTSAQHTQGTDTALGTMAADIDMNNAQQVVNLQAPAASGEAIRQTANITEASLETLTDNSVADTSHRHSELVSPDGSPDPAVSVDNDGNTTAVGQVSITGASRMRANRAAAQSIPNAIWTIVQYNIENWDNLGEYDNSVNYRFTATKTGYYAVTASLLSASAAWGAGGIWLIGLFKNGVDTTAGFYVVTEAAITTYRMSALNDIVYLAATDYVDIRCYQDRGAATNCHSNVTYNFFTVHRLS